MAERSVRRLRVNGVELVVHDEGDGPPVLLIHGFPDDRTVWKRQISALVTAGYRVIVPDTRGCGDSEMPARTEDYTLANLVGDMVALLDALGIARVRLVGHDWGAVIGWHMAMWHADRVECYAALSVGHPAAYADGGLMQKLKGYYVLVFQMRAVAEWLIRARNWKALRRMIGSEEEAAHVAHNLERPGRLTAGLAYYRANFSLLVAGSTGRVAVPVMGVFSDGDRFLTKRQMLCSADFVDGAFRFEMLPGVGHWLQRDAPAATNALLLDFLGGEVG